MGNPSKNGNSSGESVLNARFRSLILSLIIGFVTVMLSGKSFGQSTIVPQYIKVDLKLQSNSYYRRDVNDSWVTNAHSWSTSIVLGSDKWRIESGMPINATELCYCDGTNVFFKDEINSSYQPRSQSAAMPSVSAGYNQNIVVVVPGAHPMGDFGLNLVWLAYCSGDYLRSGNRLLPLSAGEPRHHIELFYVEDKSVLSESPPFLPSKIEFLANKANAAKAAQSQFIFRSEEPVFIPTLETDGTLLAAYQVEQFTNYSEWTIPVAFTYFQTNRPILSERGYFVTGKVTKISEATAPRSLLEEGMTAFIEDTRFRHPDRLFDSMPYTLTKSVLPATNDPAILAAMKELAGRRPLVGK
jgi:hypothetical protein